MTFERTFDRELIKRVITHPRVFKHISDDLAPKPEAWSPVESEAVWYVTVKDDSGLLGMFIFMPHNSICWEVHTCMLPAAYGPKAVEATHQMTSWIWANTQCRRIITEVPAYNTLAYRLAVNAGMVEFGRNPQAFLRNGVLYDIALLGLSQQGVY